jgi:DNA modification methylase
MGWGVTNYQLHHGDCLEVMRGMADKSVDAIITDPPYGIGEAAGKNKSRVNIATPKDYGDLGWDDNPVDFSYMEEMFRVSRYQIVFGGNYYPMPPSSCWLVWDKVNGKSDFADCELAWTNMKKAVRKIEYMWNGMLRANGENRGDHPTQKPIGVMRWCIEQLPDTVDTILDPFMGSGTTGVACMETGRKFIGIELDKGYFEIAEKRIHEATRQQRLF